MSNTLEILTQLQQLLSKNLAEAGQALSAYLPSLLTALLLLLMGWVLARMVQSLVQRFGQGIDRLMAWLHHQTVPDAQPPTNPPSTFFARGAYWLVLLLFTTAAAEALGLPGLDDWVTRFIQYLPNVIACAAIILLGFALAGVAQRLAEQLAQEQSMAAGLLLGRTVKLLVIVLAAVLGIGQLAVDISLLINLISIAAASVLGGLGLAFGLGARQQVSNIIAAQNLRSLYQPGQRICINGVEGEVLELTPKAVILKTDTGQALIPAHLFSEQVVQLIVEDAANG